jgi:putative ABC transport system permease protein
MSLLRKIVSGLWSLFQKNRAERELDAELNDFLEMAAQEKLKQSMTRQEALRMVRLEHGSVGTTREIVRSAGWESFVEACWQDLRFAARVLRKSPGFTTVVVLTLALGIGANTAIFQLLDAVTMRTLPVSKPEELVEVDVADMTYARGSVESWHPAVTNPIWEEIVRRQDAFSKIFAWSPGLFNLNQSGEARWASGLEVSGGFFSALGIQPAMGRLFVDADDQHSCDAQRAVLSYAFWQSEYAGDPSVIGRRITLEHGLYEIIGVVPENFTGLEVGRKFDVAVPLCAEATLSGDDNRLNSSTDWWLIVMARLKPGWTLDRARAELSAISPAIFEASVRPDYPNVSLPAYLKFTLTAHPAGGGISQLRESYSRSLWLLFGITALVLLIACANLANLMLARAGAREREWTLRAALGASRGHLLRQTLTESVLLAVTGTVLAVWLAGFLSRLLLQLLATRDNPIFLPIPLDWRTLAFTAGVTVGTCILFSLAPVLRSINASPSAALKSSGRGITSGRGRFSTRRVLVVCQIAFSLMLLIEALLFTRSFVNLTTVNTGLDSHGVLISYLDLSRLNLPVERRLPFKSDLIQRLEQIPGVAAAAETDIVPLSGSRRSNQIWMQGSDSYHQTECMFSTVGDGFFQTLGIHVLAGRNFASSDILASPGVAIVNESFVREVLNGRNPLGLEFWREATPRQPEAKFEIVGVVNNSKYRSLWQPPGPVIYLPESQNLHPEAFAQVVVRANSPPTVILPSVKQTVAQISPDIIATFQVFDTMVHDSLTNERLMAWLSSFFGLLAILLAATGLYGVIAYMVLQRTNEVGIRMALGADGGSILRLFLGETISLLVVGCLTGAALSLTSNQAARTLLYGLKPFDPVTLFASVLLVAVVAIAASFIPTRRAMRVDPTVALRYE